MSSKNSLNDSQLDSSLLLGDTSNPQAISKSLGEEGKFLFYLLELLR